MAALTALIPLDGTKLSESALDLLPFAKSIGVSKIKLISVWQGAWGGADAPAGRPKGESEEINQKGQAYLATYLAEHAAKAKALGFEVETIVKAGKAADAVEEAAKTDTDLILIATHGRTGIQRWRLGSVADKIIRETDCPTLVIGPNVTVELSSYVPKRILAPVDGSDLSEQAIKLAGRIADLTGAALDLTRVVPTPTVAVDPSMGVYPIDLIQAVEDDARDYLAEKAKALGATHKVTTNLRLGSPPDLILAHMEEEPVDLVVVASRGRAGVARAALGSVADRLLQGPAPVLVFLPGDGVNGRLLTDI